MEPGDLRLKTISVATSASIQQDSSRESSMPGGSLPLLLAFSDDIKGTVVVKPFAVGQS